MSGKKQAFWVYNIPASGGLNRKNMRKNMKFWSLNPYYKRSNWKTWLLGRFSRAQPFKLWNISNKKHAGKAYGNGGKLNYCHPLWFHQKFLPDLLKVKPYEIDEKKIKSTIPGEQKYSLWLWSKMVKQFSVNSHINFFLLTTSRWASTQAPFFVLRF